MQHLQPNSTLQDDKYKIENVGKMELFSYPHNECMICKYLKMHFIHYPKMFVQRTSWDCCYIML